MLQIKIDTIVRLENELNQSLSAVQSEINKPLRNTGTSVRIVSIDKLKVHLHITTLVDKNLDISDRYGLMQWVKNKPCKDLCIHRVQSCSFVRITEPTNGLIEKYKQLIIPELEKQIVFNQLRFIDSLKYSHDKKRLYLTFAAFNNHLNQWQKVSFEPVTGYLFASLHHVFIDL